MAGPLEPGTFERIAADLFYGWGYTAYRIENRLRADGLLVLAKAGGLLGDARASVAAAEAVHRRDAMPPPSRARPRPDPEAVAIARAVERLSGEIGIVEGQVRTQPMPEPDRMSRWLHHEADLLMRLRDVDHRLVGQAAHLRETLEGRDAEWLVSNDAVVRERLAGLDATLRARSAILTG